MRWTTKSVMFSMPVWYPSRPSCLIFTTACWTASSREVDLGMSIDRHRWQTRRRTSDRRVFRACDATTMDAQLMPRLVTRYAGETFWLVVVKAFADGDSEFDFFVGKHSYELSVVSRKLTVCGTSYGFSSWSGVSSTNHADRPFCL